jgi:hypothetical protein
MKKFQRVLNFKGELLMKKADIKAKTKEIELKLAYLDRLIALRDEDTFFDSNIEDIVIDLSVELRNFNNE